MEKNYYVYEYIRLDTNEIFYVGKGYGGRCFKLQRRSSHFTRIINKIPCAVSIIKDNLTESEALALEEKRIHELVFEEGYSIDIEGARSVEEGQHLVNATWGGEGTSGYHHTEETIARMSEAHKGKHASEETIVKQSEAKKGENHPYYGKKRPDVSKRMKGENNPSKRPEVRAKLSTANKGENSPVAAKVICVKNNIPKAQFNTMTKAIEWLGKGCCQSISNCCRGKSKTAYKYHWAFITIIEL